VGEEIKVTSVYSTGWTGLESNLPLNRTTLNQRVFCLFCVSLPYTDLRHLPGVQSVCSRFVLHSRLYFCYLHTPAHMHTTSETFKITIKSNNTFSLNTTSVSLSLSLLSHCNFRFGIKLQINNLRVSHDAALPSSVHLIMTQLHPPVRQKKGLRWLRAT